MKSKLWEKFNSPGQALKHCLRAKGWTQEDLALILSISTKHTNEIIRNKKSVSIEIASLLNKVFEPEARDWVLLDAIYRLQNRTDEVIDKENSVALKAEIYKYIPVNELIRKGWLNKYKEIGELKIQLKEFWQIDLNGELDFSFLEKGVENLAFRKSDAHKGFQSYNALIWHQKALNHSNRLKSYPYDKKKLEELSVLIPEYSYRENGVKLFLKELEQTGVKFVYLSHLSKTYLDGAAFMSSEGPVIGMTGRYDRADNFWFTISHEIIHVTDHLDSTNSKSIYIDDTAKKHNRKSKIEQEADAGAERILMSEKILTYFDEYLGYIPEDTILEFSDDNKIHPSIVVGSLAYNNMISYSTSHRFKETIRDKIPDIYRAD